MIKNIFSNWLLMVATVAVTLVLWPFTLRVLGKDTYGVWLLISSLTGYLTLLKIGLPMASVRHLAAAVAREDSAEIETLVSSCGLLYVLIGFVALVVSAPLFYVFTTAYSIPVSLRSAACVSFCAVALSLSVGFYFELPFGILAAHKAFVGQNLVRLSSVLLRLVATVAALRLFPSIVVLASVQAACLLFEFTVAWLLIRFKYPAARLTFSAFDRRAVREVLAFSVWVLALNVGSRLTFQTDAPIIGYFLGVGYIPPYVAANSLILYLTEFVIGIAAVIMPYATALQAKGELHELKRLFLRWSKFTAVLTVFAVVSVATLSVDVMGLWLGPDFASASGEVLTILLFSHLVFLPVRGVALPVLMGIGKAKAPALIFFVAGGLNVALSVLLIRSFGLPGQALGTALPNVAFAVVLAIYTCRTVGVRFSEYVRSTFVRPASVAALLGLVGLVARRIVPGHGLVHIALVGLILGACFAPLAVSWVYQGDPDLNGLPLLDRLPWRRSSSTAVAERI